MLADPVRGRAASDGNGLALVDFATRMRLTWSDLQERAQQWASRVSLEPGDRVAAQLPAGVELTALLHACLRAGCVFIPVSMRASHQELDRVLEDCRPRFFITIAGTQYLPTAPMQPPDACILYTSGMSGLPKGVRVTLDNQRASAAG